MTNAAIDELTITLIVMTSYLLVLGIGFLVADLLFPHIPFIERYLESLPDQEDEVQKDLGMDREPFIIRRVSLEQLQEIIHRYTPRGRYLAKEGLKWVAVDNSTCDAWTEEFPRKRQAIRWLRGEFEVGYGTERWARISDAGELVAVAMRQGVKLDTGEADMILGYLEGHEYCLMVDAGGITLRHDEQYGDNHRGDEPYTIQETIEFCQEMNEDLLRDANSPNERDKEYLAHLRRDEQVLGALMERAVTSCRFQEVG